MAANSGLFLPRLVALSFRLLGGEQRIVGPADSDSGNLQDFFSERALLLVEILHPELHKARLFTNN